jgi:hypothetical protein
MLTTTSLFAYAFTHCEYQSFWEWHFQPSVHWVDPWYILPPHCPYAGIEVGVAAGADGRGTIDTLPTGTIELDATGATVLGIAAIVVGPVEGMRTVDAVSSGGIELVELAAGMITVGSGTAEAATLDEAEGSTGEPGADESRAMILWTACSATTATMA